MVRIEFACFCLWRLHRLDGEAATGSAWKWNDAAASVRFPPSDAKPSSIAVERLVPCFRILVFAVGYSNALRNVLYTTSATRQRDAWLKEGVRVYAGCRFCLAARVEQLSTSARLARVGPPPRTAATSLCDSRCRKRSQLSKRSTPRTWVTNTSDVRVNGNGYTIMPYLPPLSLAFRSERRSQTSN